AVTIAQMLSHQAGLSGFVDPIDPALWLDPPACAAAIAALHPIWPLGGGSGYHPLTWGYLAGELALRLSGESLGTTLRRIFTNSDGADPSREIIDFRIGTSASEHPRIADLKKPKSLSSFGEINAETKAAFLTKWSAADRREPAWREKEIPSANGIGTAAATARLYSVYAHRGRLGDQQILSDDTFDALTARRVIGQDRVLPFVMEFAAGVKRNNNLIFGPNPNTLGHAGWGGSAAFGDPEAEIAGAYVCNQQGAHLQGDPRATRMFEALYACL
ncbi:MAG: serine hydrolase domain-containing protein, partial [Pseudomonadota bacterium]